jgi:hypothetical protein
LLSTVGGNCPPFFAWLRPVLAGDRIMIEISKLLCAEQIIMLFTFLPMTRTMNGRDERSIRAEDTYSSNMWYTIVYHIFEEYHDVVMEIDGIGTIKKRRDKYYPILYYMLCLQYSLYKLSKIDDINRQRHNWSTNNWPYTMCEIHFPKLIITTKIIFLCETLWFL